MTRLFGFIVATLLAFASPTRADELCPPKDFVVKARNSLGAYVITWRGADPSDPSICISISEGPGSGANYGRELRRIFGYYDLVTFPMNRDNIAKASTGLQPVLFGKATEARFQLTLGMRGRGYVWTQNETWRRTGQDVITIDGHVMDAVKLELVTEPGGGSTYYAVWELWYDPIHHFFLKGHMKSGNARIQDFQVIGFAGMQTQ